MFHQDNEVVTVQQLIKYYKIPVSNQTIEEVLKSHPDYPSLKSICDALCEWKVENFPVRLNRQELREADAPFIAHLNDKGEKLVFVPKLNDNSKIHYYDFSSKRKTISEADFFNKYSGVSLMINPDENAGEEGYSEKIQVAFLVKSIPYLAGLALILFTVYSILSYKEKLNITFTNVALLLTKLVGVGFSILLVLKELNINNALVDTLCGFTKKTNCNSLLNTEASKVFGWLHWGDIGLIYFLSGLLMIISIPDANGYNFISIISLGSLGYVLFSIYYQSVVAKTWCLLCLGVQVVLIMEVVLSYKYLLPLEFSWIPVIKYTSITITIALGVVIFNIHFKMKLTSQQERLTNLKFKKNPTVFTNLLFQGKQIVLNNIKEVFVVGKPNAQIEITAFLSLNCTPCQKAFNQLNKIFNNENIKTNLIFSLHEKDKFFVNQIAQLFKEKKQREASELLYDWYNGIGNKRGSLIKQTKRCKPDDCFRTIQKAHNDLFTTAEIAGVPDFFVNGYRLPKEYDIIDTSYFIDVLSKQTHY